MDKKLRKRIIALTLSLSCSGGCLADEVKPDNELGFNLSATSDYRYRGISQTNLNPALQGSVDYTNNPTGLYSGIWLSSIHWVRDIGGNSGVEVDLYAGKRGELLAGLSYDIGALRYLYPDNKLGGFPGYVNADTTELYAQLTYKILNVKYSQALTNLFAIPDSKQSAYLDVWASIEIADGYALGLHAGHQSVQNNSALSYSDWKVGLSKELGGVGFTLGVVGTNASKTAYQSPAHQFMGKTSLVLSASKSF